MNTSTALSFNEVSFDVVNRSGQPWIRLPQIGVALGYANPYKVQQVYDRNSDEFTSAMTDVVELPTSGGIQKVRIFSLRGAHLLAMFARTAVAKAFRKWVLDILDAVTAPAKTTVDSRTPLRDAVNMLVAKKKLLYPDAYAIVHQRFAVSSIEELTVDQVPQAVEYVHKLVLDGEWIPAQKELELKPDGYLLTDSESAALSGVFNWAERSADLLRSIEAPLRMLKSSLAPDVFDGGSSVWPHLANTKKLRQHCREKYLAMEKRVLRNC